MYGGLVAIATFFIALGEAIVEWGMKVIGTCKAVLGQIHQAAHWPADILHCASVPECEKI